MSRLTVADFYYGAFLSMLLSSSSNNPRLYLFEDNETRRIYSFTNDTADYQIYMKYVTKPSVKKDKSTYLWNFAFSEDEIESIIESHDNGKKHLFGLMCIREPLNKSEIALLTFEEAKLCLGFGTKESHNNWRISVRYRKYSTGLKVYGTGLPEKNYGQDNSITVSREMIKNL